MITLKNVVIGFDKDLFAADRVGFQKGEVHVLTGKNGIGKSAFLRTLSGLLKPIQGEISLDDKALDKYSDRELSTNISFVPSEITIGGKDITTSLPFSLVTLPVLWESVAIKRICVAS